MNEEKKNIKKINIINLLIIVINSFETIQYSEKEN